MVTVSVSRRLEWDAMHRIPNHEGKCKAFHGHRYISEITCIAPQLDSLGRVVDFGILKSVVGEWIDSHWDHTAILMRSDPDPASKAIVESNAQFGKPVYLMDESPTAENIAIELAKVSKRLLKNTPVAIIKVAIWETPNCSAVWSKS